MMQVNKNLEKLKLREIVKTNKESTLLKNKSKIEEFLPDIEKIQSNLPKIEKIDPYIFFCDEKYWKNIWTVLVHTTSSLPFKEVVGRRIKILIRDKQTDYILGMVHLSSDLSSISLRDKFISWKNDLKWKGINKLLNIQTCVPTPVFSQYLTGKLLVYLSFTKEVVDKYKILYSENLIGLTTTSLYGKSSMYNRIPFLNYLGLTIGTSVLHISDEIWSKILADAKIKLGNIKPKNRLNYNRHELFEKLRGFYRKNKLEWPYKIDQTEQQENKRGVYFGYTCQNGQNVLLKNETPIYNNIDVDYRFNEWKNRWLNKRIDFIKAAEVSISDTSDVQSEGVG